MRFRISLNVYSQRTNKIEFFSEATNDTLYITDYEYVNMSSFNVSDIKLSLEEDGDLHTGHPLYLFKFIQSKAQD